MSRSEQPNQGGSTSRKGRFLMDGARFVVINDQLGVFMGSDHEGHAAWSNVDRLSLSSAVTFISEVEADALLKSLAHPGHSGIPTYRMSQVFPTQPDMRASRSDLTNAALPVWKE